LRVKSFRGADGIVYLPFIGDRILCKDITDYESVVGRRPISEVLELADKVKGLKILHISMGFKPSWSTKILSSLVPLCKSIGMKAK